MVRTGRVGHSSHATTFRFAHPPADILTTHQRRARVKECGSNATKCHTAGNASPGSAIILASVIDCEATYLNDCATAPVRIHFDVSHLAFVPWKACALDEFVARLTAHIVAIHARGPRSTGA